MRTVVELLNKDREKLAEVRALYPLNEGGTVLRYSKELSNYGECRFRISTKDPLFDTFGDIIKPHANHIRLKRGNQVVWQGAIIDNTERNKHYIEVRGAEYMFYLSKILIRRDKDKPSTDEDESNFKVFKSGTMKTAVTNIINNAASDFGNDHILGGMTVGTIENPDYPDNFVDGNGDKLTGGWSFSDEVVLTYDYHDALYIINTFGIYSSADFELTNDLKFNFKKMIGEKIRGLTFNYETTGSNIVDYNVPRFGGRMVNELTGIAADDKGNVLHATQRDTASVKTYGLLQEASAFADVKNKNILNVRLKEQLRLVGEAEESPINLTLSEKAFPINNFDVGDIVTVRIKDNVIDFKKSRRVVGYTVNVHNTGREMTVVQTNKPDDKLTSVD